MTPVKLRSLLPILLLVAVITVVGIQWDVTRITLSYAIDLWWTRLVPVMFPGYVLAQIFLGWWSRPKLGAWMTLAFLTFPPIVGLALVDLERQGRLSSDQITPLLLYTNLYNPLLFPRPVQGILLDGALLTFALILCPPPYRVPILPRAKNAPRRWIIDGMNWTSVVGLTTIAAWLVHRWFHPLDLGWLTDPLAIHWGSPQNPTHALFWAAFGGMAFWIPIFWAMPASERTKSLLYRTVQAVLAASLVYVAERILT